MTSVLKLLIEGGQLDPAQLAQVAGLSEEALSEQLGQLKRDKVFLGWRPVLDLSRVAAAASSADGASSAAGAAGAAEAGGQGPVRAVIEVRLTPERGGGFNRLAQRISRFDEVDSCFLMSGGYDLLVFVKGPSLQRVAGFVSEKLSTLSGVLSTATHFQLRCYKDQGFLLDQGEGDGERLSVAP
ncbi:AsnC family transcriptional regulator [Cephaloticoccus primus]|uniref:AsnC family transcriptional regulator n=1 Tax=Cephaloticoccus primus TaxID=1548207 RepID=A0A139SPI5_9BACT|nr:Lrp/AsnC family transcriptional regulator [Cephaloticoccus primus]KXU36432.1 AsnC family transcriptional regulator [Cephaloticoccus primus]